MEVGHAMEIDNATDRIDQTPVRDHREVEHRAKRALLRENRHLGAGEMEHARVLRSQRTSWIPQRPDTRQRNGLLLGSSCSVSNLLDARSQLAESTLRGRKTLLGPGQRRHRTLREDDRRMETGRARHDWVKTWGMCLGQRQPTDIFISRFSCRIRKAYATHSGSANSKYPPDDRPQTDTAR